MRKQKMKKLNNILYITSPDAYLSLDGETVKIKIGDDKEKRIPFHNLEGIITFGYAGASPGLMHACAQRNIALTFLSSHGRFLARVNGEQYGNVVLRKKQYRISDSEMESLAIAKNMLIGKIYNAKWVLARVVRDHAMRVDVNAIKNAASIMQECLCVLQSANDHKMLLGFEGKAAVAYFGVLDELILQQKDVFFFHGRNKRPPEDNVNALLSFGYTLLSHDCASACESVGLDAYVGFLHQDRPGRISLALDLMEELRAIMVDRFVITLINKKILTSAHFIKKENNAVLLNEEGRRIFLATWQNKKNEQITHPYLKEKIEWGMVPFVQAQLLARYLRGDLDEYAPFLWK